MKLLMFIYGLSLGFQLRYFYEKPYEKLKETSIKEMMIDIILEKDPNASQELIDSIRKGPPPGWKGE